MECTKIMIRTKIKFRKVLSLLITLSLVGGLIVVPETTTHAAPINLAYGKTVTVTSVQDSNYPGSYAVDANGNTRWASTAADNQSITVDLGSAQTVSSVLLKWEAAYATQFQIQTSTNNSTWTTVYSNYSGTGGTSTINFTAISARYVKMYGIKRATTYGFSLYEFEIYGATTVAATGVLDYIKSISGKQTVIGMHNREPNSTPAVQTDRAYSITGQYPGMWSGDFLFSSSDVSNRWTMIYECKKQWDNGAIVQLMFHVTPPTQSEPGTWDGGVVSELTDAQWTTLITNGGTLNKAWKARLDTYATYLQYLEDNKVTVLVRPFHEMNQSMFWWAGRPGTNGTAALYRLTRDYLVTTKGLSNLVWVWDMQDLDLNWGVYNPGNAYWDIFALDVYNTDRYTTAKYNAAVAIAGTKPIAIGECDKLPTASVLAAQPKWAFCLSWSELTFSFNTNTEIQNLYWATNVLVRNELPKLK